MNNTIRRETAEKAFNIITQSIMTLVAVIAILYVHSLVNTYMQQYDISFSVNHRDSISLK